MAAATTDVTAPLTSWRVDVTLSSSSLRRVLRPKVLVRLVLDDGSVHTFEMGMKEFAELRCSTALALRECRRIHVDEGLRRVEQLGTRRSTYVQS